MPPKMKALLPHSATECPTSPASSGGDTGSAAQAAPGLLLEGPRRTTWALLVDGVPCMLQGAGFGVSGLSISVLGQGFRTTGCQVHDGLERLHMCTSGSIGGCCRVQCPSGAVGGECFWLLLDRRPLTRPCEACPDTNPARQQGNGPQVLDCSALWETPLLLFSMSSQCATHTSKQAGA